MALQNIGCSFGISMDSITIKIISSFLTRCKLISSNSMIIHRDTYSFIDCGEVFPYMTRAIIMVLHDIVDVSGIASMEQGDFIVLVTQDYQHATEILTYSKCSILDLMNKNVLIVHMKGMIYSLSIAPTYRIIVMSRDDNVGVDRRHVLDMCDRHDIAYETMLGDTNDTMTKANHVFYSRSDNPLELFGVEYLFSVFRQTKISKLQPENSLYILRSEDSLNVAKIH